MNWSEAYRCDPETEHHRDNGKHFHHCDSRQHAEISARQRSHLSLFFSQEGIMHHEFILQV